VLSRNDAGGTQSQSERNYSEQTGTRTTLFIHIHQQRRRVGRPAPIPTVVGKRAAGRKHAAIATRASTVPGAPIFHSQTTPCWLARSCVVSCKIWPQPPCPHEQSIAVRFFAARPCGLCCVSHGNDNNDSDRWPALNDSERHIAMQNDSLQLGTIRSSTERFRSIFRSNSERDAVTRRRQHGVLDGLRAHINKSDAMASLERF
jgi:hypothetical protein